MQVLISATAILFDFAKFDTNFLTSKFQIKPTSLKITRNEEAEMRAWPKMHSKFVRQRNVRQDNTMDMQGGHFASELI